MSVTSRKAGLVAVWSIGAVFAGQLARFWWLKLTVSPVGPGDFYALDDALAIVGSSLWTLGGALHVVTAGALFVLATCHSPPEPGHDFRAQARAAAATIGAALFLLLGMMHLVGGPQIGAVTAACPGDARTLLPAYELLRTVLSGGGLFALGWFVLIDAGRGRRSDVAQRFVQATGWLAGILCVSFVFLNTAAPAVITTVTMLAVAAWGFGRAVLNDSAHSSPRRKAS